MEVGDDETGSLTALNVRCITFNGLLIDGIDDAGTVCIFIQIGETSCPVIGFIQLQGITGIRAVRQQLHDDGTRADPIPVAAVAPELDHVHLDLPGVVAVGGFTGQITVPVSSADRFRYIIAQRAFLNNVGDLRLGAVYVFISRQAGDGPVKGIFRDGGGHHLTVSQDIKVNPIRAGPVGSVAVIPCLGPGYVDGFGLMGVGDDVAGLL